MRLDHAQMRARVGAARSARLATVRPGGDPHLVPMVFALDGDHLWSAIDHKPKTTRDLARLRNIATHPRVSVLVDHYDDDWTRLWWVRLDGHAAVVADDRPTRVLDLLAARYPQYRSHPPDGPLIDIRIDAWRGWAAAGD